VVYVSKKTFAIEKFTIVIPIRQGIPRLSIKSRFSYWLNIFETRMSNIRKEWETVDNMIGHENDAARNRSCIMINPSLAWVLSGR
jgi:hypothetical protein